MPKSNRDSDKHYRARMRTDGLRPLQIWVPDTSAPGFAAEYARQCRIADRHPDHDVDAFVERRNRVLERELDVA